MTSADKEEGAALDSNGVANEIPESKSLAEKAKEKANTAFKGTL